MHIANTTVKWQTWPPLTVGRPMTSERYWASFQVTRLFHSATIFSNHFKRRSCLGYCALFNYLHEMTTLDLFIALSINRSIKIDILNRMKDLKYFTHTLDPNDPSNVHITPYYSTYPHHKTIQPPTALLSHYTFQLQQHTCMCVYHATLPFPPHTPSYIH